MRRFLFSAWGISLALHLAALAALGISMHAWPRGAGDGGSHSMGLVLNRSKDEGELRNGDSGDGDQLKKLEEVPQGPGLLATPSPALPAMSTKSELAPTTRSPEIVQASASEAAKRQMASAGYGRSGAPGGTGEAKVRVFGVEGHGRKFLYLFDRSASMEGAPLSAANPPLLH